ncbi:hypothetical protein EUA50_12085 [Staphylococcus saprophyticus]|uniref:hypothetical protein n=1 Tax=Staphylococcus saprophyticus TaxID=29385 RepID=UPI000852ECC7|nr:hypothetical protein [Staphylococcus saprophyticus]MDW4342528.1 hypothetical protein [Staphylococcus saprophyticus]MDW4386963.1 hypothetical protein [Staphylococcus saprophyticus]MDW4419057.1 hypothetical protein [Staphylococcus saprophyticus]MDW4473522.1 hypothetical protein [Staphylococcus saprophyticus]OEK45524.1 hypothetical protein ASS92_06080 [Staphylococcus saprophyticus]
MKNTNVSKGKLLVDATHHAGMGKAFRQTIDLIVEKMDNITDKDSNEYSVLNELLNEIWDKHNEVGKLEVLANEKLDQLTKS